MFGARFCKKTACSAHVHSSRQHLLQSPHYRPIEYPCSPAQPESTSYDPSESSRHRIGVRVSGPVNHPSRKTVAIEFESQSAAQSTLHRNPVNSDIKFGSPAHWQPVIIASLIHRKFGIQSRSSSNSGPSERPSLSSIGKLEQSL